MKKREKLQGCHSLPKVTVKSGLVLLGLILMLSVSSATVHADIHNYSVNNPDGLFPPYTENFDSIHEALDWIYGIKWPHPEDETVYVDVFPGTYIVDAPAEGVFNQVIEGKFSRLKLFAKISGRNTVAVHLRPAPSVSDEVNIESIGVNSPFWIAKGSVEDFVFTYEDFGRSSLGKSNIKEPPPNKGISISGPCKVKGCEVSGFDMGIVGFCASNFSNSNEPTVSNCNTHHNMSGFCTGEMNVCFKNNYSHDNIIGFKFGPGGSPFLLDNLIKNNTTGIQIDADFRWAAYGVIKNNIISGNEIGIDSQSNGWHYTEDDENPQRVVDFPICALIENNIIVNYGYYGMLCRDIPSGNEPQDRELLFSYMQYLTNNNLWSYGGTGYVNCPDIYDSLSKDPLFLPNQYCLSDLSPCINNGRFDLNPGRTVNGTIDDESIDLGYHQKSESLLSEYNGTIWIVDAEQRRPYHFASIQDAINSPVLQHRDVIKIRKTTGSYQENVVLDKPYILLTSESDDENERATIMVENGPAVSVTGRGAGVSNLIIQRHGKAKGEGSGIQVQSRCKISNCFIQGHTDGICMETNEASQIQYCVITDCNDNGIEVSGGFSGSIFSNWIEKLSGNGIDLSSDSSYVTNCIIENNTISGCGQSGIYADFDAVHEHQGIFAVLFNNVVFFNESYGFNTNRWYTELKGETGIFPHMRNNNFWGNCQNQAHQKPYNSELSFYNFRNFQFLNEKLEIDHHWICPYPINPDGHSVRMFNPMSFDPDYDMSSKTLKPYSECIDAGCYNLEPGNTERLDPDIGMIDIGMHQVSWE